ncbi:ubiquitin-conjugating enzyme E2 32-like isoform X1 [Oryzias latipes]|uniref:ubiquitin-conjugating enzyme E2 32-like isoform X1 n=1 Tax=Oryzias latipes TaxID=8090 RepID=UPI000CE2181B|nr:ubiquitin-conjugating enzyme E2 32-like isoform X1 [Oryzias latipes]
MAQHGQNVASSQKALMLEMKNLQEEPVEGFKITLVDESDLYNWEVAIFGPPNTHYEGGYFKARIKFPVDYPYSPPAFRFLTKMWHPNIYEVTTKLACYTDLRVCICPAVVSERCDHFVLSERRRVHLHPASARGRPAERRTALREVEPHAERQDDPAERHLPPERAQYLFSGQRGRVRHVPQVEGQQGQGQRVHRDNQETGSGHQSRGGAGRRQSPRDPGRVLRPHPGHHHGRRIQPFIRRLLRRRGAGGGRRGRERGLLLRRGRLRH